MTKKDTQHPLLVYVPGTWDLFHYGHVRLLRRAAKISRGGQVIAGVNSDAWVKRTKGKTPIMREAERKQVLAACRYVSKAICVAEPLEKSVLRRFSPDVIVIGSDWQGKFLKGSEKVKDKIVFVPYTKTISTTKIIQRIKKEAIER
jgi:glycerol-3-phosphate cytidylyltransferase